MRSVKEIGWIGCRCCAMVACAAMMTGCLSAYRYSAQPVGGHLYEMGRVDVRGCRLNNLFLANITSDHELLQQIRSALPVYEDADGVCLEVSAHNAADDNEFFLLNGFTLGLVPGYQKRVYDLMVDVIDDRHRKKGQFEIRLVHKERRMPLGLWPFAGEDYDGERYATAIGFSHRGSKDALESVLSCVLIEGLTKQNR